MTAIAEAYFHLKPFGAGPSLVHLGSIASSIAARSATGIYPPDTEIEVRLSVGSLRGWVTVVAVSLSGMLGAYEFIANYKGFKEGVSELVADGKKFSAAFNESFISQTAKSQKQVFRTERRTKTPGKILKAAKRLEWLEQHQAQLTKANIKAEKAEIGKILVGALQDLSEDDQAFIKRFLSPSEEQGESVEEPRVAVRREILTQLPLFSHALSEELPTPPDYLDRFFLGDFLQGDRRHTFIDK